ncbi:DUF1799 domain-containing protein [Tropicibacter sp. S64]|uniref:DUF1799 domain-containing protein n=1 Tax=Tropicibacter sp. S64 TaxID=3415122 RepID=UPI003C7DEDC1
MLGPVDEQDGLWAEHIPAVEAYLAIGSQWRTLPQFGAPPRWLGLDYTAAEAGLRLAGFAMTPELWAEVRLIEQGAKAALNGD